MRMRRNVHAGTTERDDLDRGTAMSSLERSETTPAGHSRRDLQRASDFQAALLGIAGHDLRQPLQVIQGAYELLGAHVSSKSERAWLERGERAIARLTEQLDELVGALHLYEYAKSLEISPVALAPLFWRLCDENGDAALRNGIDLRVCPTRASVISNPLLLNGVLRNLVRNAIKYTQPGGRVLIGCRRSGPDARIDVCDTGIGIAPEHLPRIFQAFERLDTTRCDGLGIGLFVVRRAIELLGHRIEVSSCVARGSRFSVRARRSR
jgi:two-component system phosphate regulon sensor histidine kinase PhoR